MRQGVLIYNKETERIHIRFDLDDYSNGLHCGDCMDVMIHGRWKPTRLEMDFQQHWQLVGVPTFDLVGLRVRIEE